ncbi:MAG: hypothetical protein N4A71_14955 [Carboxylicivirga sp.]|nr:hypothetical protein [Carboxylicivirga sp.]
MNSIEYIFEINNPFHEIKVTDSYGNEYKNKILEKDIFYIEYVDRTTKSIVLNKPLFKEFKDSRTIEWKTRDSLDGIIEKYLGRKSFVQINQKVITRRINVIGRSADWTHLQLRIRDDSQRLNWLTKKLKLGKPFRPQLEDFLNHQYLQVKNIRGNSSSDYIFIHPLDIIYIENSKSAKKMHLRTPYNFGDTNEFMIEYHSRKKITDITINNTFGINSFIQIHRKFVINIELAKYTVGTRSITMTCPNKKQKLPIGEKYYEDEEYFEIINALA